MDLSSIELKEMGSRTTAQLVFEKFREGSSAYRKLVEDLDPGDWRQLPLLTKKSFYDAHSWREIVPRGSYKDIYSIISRLRKNPCFSFHVTSAVENFQVFEGGAIARMPLHSVGARSYLVDLSGFQPVFGCFLALCGA